MSIESVMSSNHLILCHPLLLLPSSFPSVRVFSNESVLRIRWPKYWSFTSVSVLSINIQDWFPLGWIDLISLLSKGLTRLFCNTTVQKHQFFGTQLSLEKAMATHSSTLDWKIPWTEEPSRLQSMGSQRVGHDWATSLSLFTFIHWRRKWQPTPVFFPGELQGRRSLVGCRPWGC